MFERVIAGLLVVILLPIFFLLSFLIFIFSGRPIFFRQNRSGQKKKSFLIYKFRTMYTNAEKKKEKYVHLNQADGPVFKIKNDPRFTKLGKFLSYTALDELPQLINIIKGEMAFVGPRPLPIDEAKKIPIKYQNRFFVLPGITSLWVVNGGHKLSFDEWMQLDLWYVKHKSLLVDIQISLRTLVLVFKMYI